MEMIDVMCCPTKQIVNGTVIFVLGWSYLIMFSLSFFHNGSRRTILMRCHHKEYASASSTVLQPARYVQLDTSASSTFSVSSIGSLSSGSSLDLLSNAAKDQLHRIDLLTSKLSIRPLLDDIERLSRGEAAKRRGTGSRQVPHRLNSMERKEWELAKVRRFLMLRGTGYRRERGDSPLANIYRNYCDATSVPCISIIRNLGIDSVDQVVVDFSPLRTLDGIGTLVQYCRGFANEYSSCVKIVEYSEVIQLQSMTLSGNGNHKVFNDQPIWNIPPFGLVLSFAERSDGRKFGELLGYHLARGNKMKKQLAN